MFFSAILTVSFEGEGTFFQFVCQFYSGCSPGQFKVMSSRVHLSLKDKVDLINVSVRERLSVRDLAARYKIGKTQVSDILKKKKEWLEKWSQHGNIHSQKSFPKSIGLNIDNITYEWFCRARAAKIPLSGPLIREKALEVAKSLGARDFKASVGWLDKFKSRHAISWKSISGEGGAIDKEVVTEWAGKLKDLCIGFGPKDTFNCDETGLFFRALPEKTMNLKNEICQGGKISKERLTVLLCTNMLGEFEQPLVIGKAQKPRCFKGINLNLMNVQWKSNRKAWMTRDIMSEWLSNLDQKMIRQNRKIILFMDNAASHPHIELSNVKIAFLPPNTTAACQPLDQGIIKNFKVKYRKRVLRHLIANMDNATSASDLGKKISVLDAIQWISSAINEIEQSTVVNCFVKSGFPNPLNNDVDNNTHENDVEEFDNLLKIYNPSSDQKYTDIDSNLTTEDNCLDIIKIYEDTLTDDEEMESEPIEEEIIEEPPMKIEEALIQIKRLKAFFTSEGDAEGFSMVSSIQANIENKIVNRRRVQKKITDFFP